MALGTPVSLLYVLDVEGKEGQKGEMWDPTAESTFKEPVQSSTQCILPTVYTKEKLEMSILSGHIVAWISSEFCYWGERGEWILGK